MTRKRRSCGFVLRLCHRLHGCLEYGPVLDRYRQLAKAVERVDTSLHQSMGSLFHNRVVTACFDIPKHTDIDSSVYYRQNKHVLFGQQESRWDACHSEFPFHGLELDHGIPSVPVAKTTSKTRRCCAFTATG